MAVRSPVIITISAVSYTHLDVYKRQLLSREVTVTKSGVRPKQVAFQKADLASAVAIKPPDTAPPAQLQAVSVRTEPELAAGDEKTVDQKLMALLPKPDEIDRQLREAKDPVSYTHLLWLPLSCR